MPTKDPVTYQQIGRKDGQYDMTEYRNGLTLYERIRMVYLMYERYEDYWKPETYRLIRNQRMAWGVNFGQWPSYVVEKLRIEGRRPPTFNFVGKKVETQVSAFQNNPFNVKYMPSAGELDSLALKVQDMYLSDKANLDWATSESIALRDMFIMVGYERMLISDQFNKEFGNIAWEPIHPIHVYLDPGWKSGYVRDLKRYYEYGYYTVEEIIDMFPQMEEQLGDIRAREERQGIDLGEFNGGIRHYKDTEQKWGDRHKVIFHHWVEPTVRNWEWDLKNNCAFPETGFPVGSDDDHKMKQRYMEIMGVDPNFEVTTVRQKRNIKYVEAICPSIDGELMLTFGKDKIQTNNINLYPVGNQFNGQFKGTVDELYDTQIQFNKGEMIIEDMTIRTAKGAFLLDRLLAGGDSNRERQIETLWNDPAARIWVDEGATADLGPNGGIIELPQHQAHQDLFHQNDKRMDYFDRLSLMPAAADARTESSSESGRLFQSKFRTALLGQKYQREIFKRHVTEKAKAYIIQAKHTYAGWPREFSRVGGDAFVINLRQSDEQGNVYIYDDISTLPEMKVVITESHGGEDIRTELRTQYGELLPIIAQDPMNRLLMLILLGGVSETMELKDEDKEEIRHAIDLLKSNAALEQAVLHMNLNSQLSKMQQAVSQMGEQQGLAAPESEAIPQQISAGEMGEEEAIAGTVQQGDFAQIP